MTEHNEYRFSYYNIEGGIIGQMKTTEPGLAKYLQDLNVHYDESSCDQVKAKIIPMNGCCSVKPSCPSTDKHILIQSDIPCRTDGKLVDNGLLFVCLQSKDPTNIDKNKEFIGQF